ncbi:MAG: helix-turn-helix domain-containing protein [Candidatus Bathyarchaeia archaeon]|jgi:sugar-specific transcriptional regulator TrmB
MTFDEQDVETLVAIGLTRTQAKVYLTLASLGKAKANTIWKNSGVARQDIYRILTELEGKSLVEKILGDPTEFRTVPLPNALSALLKRKTDEYKKIEKITEKFLDRFRANPQENTKTEEFEFAMISTRDANVRKMNKAAINTKKSVDVIDSWDSFQYSMAYAELLIKGAKRKVKFRYITDKPKDGERVPKIFQTWEKKGWVELRHIPTQPTASVRIEDGEQVTLCITKSRHTMEAPSLFSNNPCLVAILQDYFEMLWSKATEDNT